jgi:hypothetical protein
MGKPTTHDLAGGSYNRAFALTSNSRRYGQLQIDSIYIPMTDKIFATIATSIATFSTRLERHSEF